MTKIIGFFPFLLGFTLSGTSFSLGADVSKIGNPILGILESMFTLLIQFGPYLLIFGFIIFLLNWLTAKLTFKKTNSSENGDYIQNTNKKGVFYFGNDKPKRVGTKFRL